MWMADELAPDEILVDNTVRTLVPGYVEWSFIEYHGSSWHKRSVYLYYKNYVADHFLHQKHGYVCYEDHQRKFATLQDIVATYQRYSLVQSFERWNQEKGIEGDAWCQARGTPLTTVTITIPQALLEQAQAVLEGCTIQQWVIDQLSLYADNRQGVLKNAREKRA